MSRTLFVNIKNGDSESQHDLYSLLLAKRAIFLTGEIDTPMAESLMTQLFYLNSESHDPISLYINSGGGSVSAGLAIYDTMQTIKAPVRTIAIGKAYSMAAVLLAAGEKGSRKATEHTRIMIHEPSGGAEGRNKDVKIWVSELDYANNVLVQILAKHTKKSKAFLNSAMEKDVFLDPNSAIKYGLIDSLIKSAD